MATTPISMPRLGMTMEEGTVVEWPIAVGARVEKGETLLVIETEKAEAEIEATLSGVFRHAFAEPGDTLPCGALLAAVTDAADEEFDAAAFEAAYVPPPGAVSEELEAPTAAASISPPAQSQRRTEKKAVVPAARALAKKLDLDLDAIVGSGPNGRVTKQDVEQFAAARERLTPVEDGIALEVLREGSGEPLVLLPGFGTDVSSFALQTPELSQHFEVIGINPRGVGASDAPAQSSYDVERAAEDVSAIVNEPAHIVGASLGAAVAIEFALRHPHKVRSLSLITPFSEASPRLLAFAEAWSAVANEASPETVAVFLAPWLFGDRLLGEEAARTRTLRGLAQSVKRIPASTLQRTAAGLAAWSGTRTADLEEIEARTLVLAGGADLLTPNGSAIAEAIPNAKLEVLEACGHGLVIDAAAEVTQFLIAHTTG